MLRTNVDAMIAMKRLILVHRLKSCGNSAECVFDLYLRFITCVDTNRNVLFERRLEVEGDVM